MNKWLLMLAVMTALGYGAVRLTAQSAGEKPPELNTNVGKVTDTRNQSTIKVTRDQIYRGDLLLVNKDHRVPAAGSVKDAVKLAQHRELLTGFGLLDNTIQLSPDLTGKFAAMVQAAEQDGVNHFVISSGYRDEREQGELFAEKGAEYAMPAGYSEHNLGLSIDIGSTKAEMNRAAEGKWLVRNAWKYGFILRYPKDKSDVTGIQYEPWHFRYVGLPHSAIMQEHHFVLEEYLDFLKKEKQVSITIDHRTYEVSYYPVAGRTSISVPASGPYEISGNNMDGVIVTVSS